VLGTGEYKAGKMRRSDPRAGGLGAKRLLIVGLGKLAKATVHGVREAAGTAVRFAKPRGIRELALRSPKTSPKGCLMQWWRGRSPKVRWWAFRRRYLPQRP